MNTVYLLPGLGAKSDIYRRIRFPRDYRIKAVEWLPPLPKESLREYAERLIRVYAIRPGNVLTGMSFGGIVINEISRLVPPSRMIFISTVKSGEEFPPWYRWAARAGLYRFFPYKAIVRPMHTAAFMPLKRLKKRLMLYEQYLSIRDPEYFRWAVEQILDWQGQMPPYPYLHVHGKSDRVFPVRFLKGKVRVVPGDHLVMLSRPALISRHIKEFLDQPYPD